MSTVSESNFSVKSTTWSINDAIKKLKATPCTRKNVSGTFISDKSLGKLEKAIFSAMEKPTESSTTLIALHDEVTALRQESQKAKDSLKAATARERSLSNDLEKARLALGEMQQQATARHAEINAEKQRLKGMMDDIVLQQKKLAADKNRFDADIAVKQHEESQALSVEHLRLKNLLTAANAEKNALNVQVRALQANVQSLSVDKVEVAADVSEAHRIKLEVNTRHSKPIPVQINSASIKRALGQRGLEWLQKLDDISRDNLRERAFSMMQASNNSKNVFWKGLNALLSEIWKWIKQQSAKTVKRIKPWLDSLEADFRAGKMKAIKHYRQELEQLHLEISKQAAVAADSRGPHQSPDLHWWEHGYLYARVFYNRLVKRPLKRGLVSVKKSNMLDKFRVFFTRLFWGDKFVTPTSPGDFGDDFLPGSFPP